MKTMMAVAAFAPAIGSAEAGTGPKTGTLVVYRQWSPGGMAARFVFNINHGPDVRVNNGAYRRFALPPGDYIVSHDHLFGAGQDLQRVNLEAGKTVYFQYVSAWSLIFEVADDQEQAARTVSKMKEQVN
jgi:hypothetical protein